MLTAIGIGVPAVVDPIHVIVYDVQNIPAWKEIHLKKYSWKEFKCLILKPMMLMFCTGVYLRARPQQYKLML